VDGSCGSPYTLNNFAVDLHRTAFQRRPRAGSLAIGCQAASGRAALDEELASTIQTRIQPPTPTLASAWRADYAGSFTLVTLFPSAAVRLRSIRVVSDPTQVPDFAKGDGLLPAIAQDTATGAVLMLAYMNAESYAETLKTGRAVYYSRSRNRLWRKGEESGHVQEVRAIFVDCDADTILLKVHQVGGAACHEGYASCFFRQVTPEGLKVIGQRVFDPKEVYKK
jgi:phosphoribosyl-AMP cyclohydrolase